MELSTRQACCKTLSSTVGEKPLTSSKIHPHLEDSRDAHIVGEPWMGVFFCLLFVLLLLSHFVTYFITTSWMSLHVPQQFSILGLKYQVSFQNRRLSRCLRLSLKGLKMWGAPQNRLSLLKISLLCFI